VISPTTLQGYAETTYAILVPDGEPVGLRLHEHSPEADALLDSLGADTLCCLTAWNPCSRRYPATRNMAAHQRLRRDLARRGWPALPHLGVPDQRGWRAEPGFAIPGITKEKATGLAETYGQFGIVFYERGGVAELILTRRALR
jgi:hypothetical protein